MKLVPGVRSEKQLEGAKEPCSGLRMVSDSLVAASLKSALLRNKLSQFPTKHPPSVPDGFRYMQSLEKRNEIVY